MGLGIILLCIIVITSVSFISLDAWLIKTHASTEEGFQDIVYTNVSAIKTSDATPRLDRISGQKVRKDCQNLCTAKDKCGSFSYNVVTQECDLYEQSIPSSLEYNADGIYTISMGMKERLALGKFDANVKYYRLKDRALPKDNSGNTVNYNFVNSLGDCQTKCIQSKDSAGQRCIAFQYNFDKQNCQVAKAVVGEFDQDPSSDTYLIIN